jgi:hypothetical protein
MKTFVIIIMLLFLSTIGYSADYGETETKGNFTYYKIIVNGKDYFCESYEETEEGIIMKGVFIEGSTEAHSEYMIVPSAKIDSIQKKSAKTKQNVINSENACFINSLRW